jgi:DHA1 family multidrug resistance protein-like MFS transporter
MQLYGRKIAVVIPMFIFICLSAGTATATNLQTIFITRFFAGVMASSPVATVGGGLADMFNQRERGTAVVFYSLAVVAGPTLGPIIGGAVSQSSLGWRWTMYLAVILTSAVVLADAFFLPETFAPVLLTRKARRLRLKTQRWGLHSRQEMQEYTLKSFLEKNLLRPIKMLMFEPMVLLITLYNSFACTWFSYPTFSRS